MFLGTWNTNSFNRSHELGVTMGDHGDLSRWQLSAPLIVGPPPISFLFLPSLDPAPLLRASVTTPHGQLIQSPALGLLGAPGVGKRYITNFTGWCHWNQDLRRHPGPKPSALGPRWEARKKTEADNLLLKPLVGVQGFRTSRRFVASTSCLSYYNLRMKCRAKQHISDENILE